MKRVRWFILIGGWSLLLLGSLWAPVQAQSTVIKIVTQSPLSGNQEAQGVSIRNGTELAIEQLGGRLRDQGFELQFGAYDDEGNPAVGVANAELIVADPTIYAVIGHFNSGVAIPSSEVYNDHDLVMVSPANTNPNITDRGLPTVNRVCGRDDLESVVAAQHLESLGIGNVFIIYDTTVYGEGVAASFRANAEELGLLVVGYASISQSETDDFSDVVTQVMDTSPESVFLGGDVMGGIAGQLGAAGYEGQLIGASGLDTPTFTTLAGDVAMGTFYTTTQAPATAFPEAAQFIRDYTERFGIPPIGSAAESYDSTGIVLEAIERAVEISDGVLPPRVRVSEEVRATTDYRGLTGVITFDDNGDREEANYFVIEIAANDPNRWSENRVINRLQILSPIAADEEN